MPVDRETFRARYGPWALVAGAAAGLGAEWSRQLAALGLNLLALDRDAEPLAAMADRVAKQGVKVDTAVVDLARPDVLDALAPHLAGREIGLLVCNAAVGVVAPMLSLTVAEINAAIDVNCRAPALLVHALAPEMARRRRGGVVLMSSMSGSYGSSQLAVYAATKAFDLVFADALWVELREHGVDVLAVQPGSTRTPGWESSQLPENRGPGPHVMEPADVVAEAIETLGREPVVIPGEQNKKGAAMLATLPRRQAIELVSAMTRDLVTNAGRR
jgi:short-subunit dehydrogenase